MESQGIKTSCELLFLCPDLKHWITFLYVYGTSYKFYYSIAESPVMLKYT